MSLQPAGVSPFRPLDLPARQHWRCRFLRIAIARKMHRGKSSCASPPSLLLALSRLANAEDRSLSEYVRTIGFPLLRSRPQARTRAASQRGRDQCPVRDHDK